MNTVIKNNIRDIYYHIGALKLNRLLMSHFKGVAAILTFHRILPEKDTSDDVTANSITIDEFEAILEYVSKEYLPVSIDALGTNLKKEKKLPVIITLDDGYRDNLYVAMPLLQKFRIPAVIYITTKFPEGDCRMWWYELIALCNERNELALDWGGKILHWQLNSPIDKEKCFGEIHDILLACNYAGQNGIMDQLRAGADPIYFNDICLTWDEIKSLDSEPLITIGAHTHSHPVLAKLNEKDAFDEIVTSKQLLETRLNHRVNHFAYPYGNIEHAGDREYRMVEDIGFQTAVTTRCFSIGDVYNKFSLPRHMVHSYHCNKTNIDVKLSGWNAFWGRQL